VGVCLYLPRRTLRERKICVSLDNYCLVPRLSIYRSVLGGEVQIQTHTHTHTHTHTQYMVGMAYTSTAYASGCVLPRRDQDTASTTSRPSPTSSSRPSLSPSSCTRSPPPPIYPTATHSMSPRSSAIPVPMSPTSPTSHSVPHMYHSPPAYHRPHATAVQTFPPPPRRLSVHVQDMQVPCTQREAQLLFLLGFRPRDAETGETRVGSAVAGLG
jgi:hypothetical protein